jgi:mersacidin/lichenicidin family type 2 lantibiotic
MNTNQIIQAWKDVWHRKSLSAEQLVLLPVYPVGEVELSEEQLATLIGATESHNVTTAPMPVNNAYVSQFQGIPDVNSTTANTCPVRK